MGDLYAVFKDGNFEQAFQSSWAAYDYVDCQIDCLRDVVDAQWARFAIRAYTWTGDEEKPRPR